jgi:hypothetical protein
MVSRDAASWCHNVSAAAAYAQMSFTTFPSLHTRSRLFTDQVFAANHDITNGLVSAIDATGYLQLLHVSAY